MKNQIILSGELDPAAWTRKLPKAVWNRFSSDCRPIRNDECSAIGQWTGRACGQQPVFQIYVTLHIWICPPCEALACRRTPAVSLISFRSRPLRRSRGTKGNESLSLTPVSQKFIILIPFVSSRRRVIFREQLRQSQKYSGVLNRVGDPT